MGQQLQKGHKNIILYLKIGENTLFRNIP